MSMKKKLISTLLLLSFLPSAYAIGGEDSNTKTSSFNSIQHQLTKKLEAPLFASQSMNGITVFVEYHINNHLELVIDRMRASDSRMEGYLRKEIKKHVFYAERQEIGIKKQMKIRFN